MRAVRNFALLLALVFACAPAVRAAGYPEHTVKIIVPFPAGGVVDIATRIIAQKLSDRLGRQFYVENIGGAGGNIGMGDAARATGDGYTILFASSSIVVNPSLYKKVPFDIAKDFIPVTKAGASPNAWVVKSDFPAQTMPKLIDLMKANPGKYSIASPGTGTTPSLSIEMLKQDFGVNFVTVPFAGGGPMVQSVLGGFTPITCAAIGPLVPLIKTGKVRALAITVKKRLATLPDVPTFDEIGIKNEDAETMIGVFVPAGTPQAVVATLQKQIAAIVKLPDVKARLLNFGIVPDGDSSADFAAYVKSEIAKWKRVIENGKINRI